MSEDVRIIERTKKDYADLDGFLLRNNLVDDRHLWFAGYENSRKSTQNAIAGNLFYGYSRLIIVCLNGNDINYLRNSKKGFRLSVIGSTEDTNKVSSFRNILYPAIEIICADGKSYSIKVTKHKESIKDFKKAIK